MSSIFVRHPRALLLVLLVILPVAAEPLALPPPQGPSPAPPRLAVHSAVLLDASSGQILYAKAPNRPEPPASLTKMMTVDLALRALADGRIALSDRVPVSARAFALARSGTLSRMFLEPRRPVTVEELLFGLMVSSADDAATALAEYLAGGNTRGFVERMNEHARELGLSHTHFGDPAGLSKRSRTDALDMARLAQHVLQRHPEILRYSRARFFTYNRIRQPNYNGLLFRDPRVDGLKTGTLHGEYHLLATAEAGGVRLIALVMGAAGHEQRAEQAERLLDWGFRTVASPVAGPSPAPVPATDAGMPVAEDLAPKEAPVASGAGSR